nr:relaxase/mobilization nuclease domain-containing protein [Hymenobacter sp. IS2118]
MIIKPKINKSFPAMCRYVLQVKNPEKQAEVLATYGVRSDSAAHMAADFDAVRAMRPGLGKAVMHVIIAFPAEEKGKVTDKMITNIVRDYLKEMEISSANTQWAAVRHTDKDHPHVHLLVNRVDLDGQTVSDSFCRSRSVDAAKKLEKAYGLVIADQVGQKQAREIGPTPAQIKAITPKEKQSADWSRARQRIGSALLPCKGVQGSFAELGEVLRPQGIGVELTQRKGGSRLGVVFVLDGQRVKGKQLGTEFTADKLQEGFDQVQVARRQEQQKAADQKAADQKAADQKAADQKAADQKAADQKAADQKAADLKAAADAYSLAKLGESYGQVRAKAQQHTKEQHRTPSRDLGIGD